MVSRHVMAKFYLWMLFALTLSVAGAAAVVGLISLRGWEDRFTNLVLSEVRMGRDVAANLLRSGMDMKELERILSPLTRHTSTSVVIARADGRPVAVFADPSRAGNEDVLPDEDDIEDILEDGSLMELEHEGALVMGLPIELPSGEMGVIYVTHNKRHWVGRHFPWRILVGLGVFLGVLWLLSWPMANHLVRPLRDMARTAHELGEGNLKARIRLRGRRRDEVGSLAESFNTMAGNLEGMVAGHKQLLADISHELRSPLARLRVALELARQEAGAGEQTYLDRVEKQADAMDGLIEELLTHARLETAPYSLHSEAMRPERLLREVAAQLQGDAEERAVDIEVMPTADEGTRGLGGPGSSGNAEPVRGDPALLERALSNVLRNALAHTPHGGLVRLESGVDQTREGKRAWMRVADTGPGVAQDMLVRIFEPFVRTDSARSHGTGGVGLGLAIARRCMEAHGGGATAENINGHASENAADYGGLRVTLWWPIPSAPE